MEEAFSLVLEAKQFNAAKEKLFWVIDAFKAQNFNSINHVYLQNKMVNFLEFG